jgi:hypothetical protein
MSLFISVGVFIVGTVSVYSIGILCSHPNPPLIAVISGMTLGMLNGVMAFWIFGDK